MRRMTERIRKKQKRWKAIVTAEWRKAMIK